MTKKKKEIKVKEPVRIREKVLGDGTISLYLDMYHKGNRKKEGLKLYIIPETTPAAKLQNINTRKLAEQVKAQRILDIQKDGLVDWEKLKKSRTTLMSWLEDFVTCEVQLSPSSARSKRNAKVRVEEYLNSIGKPDLLLTEVDRDFCRGFVAFLRTCKIHKGKKTMSNTTARLLMIRIAATMNKAVVEGLIPSNPFKSLEAKEKPKRTTALREFLTVEELKVLIKTRDGRLADFSLLLFGETVNAIFNKALREGRIGFNPLRGLNKLERFHAPDKHREHLTPEERMRFLAVETASETERQVQTAFGFSCMTGLRLGDIQRLRWGDIKPMGDGWAVSIVQHKTDSPVTVPLNGLALSLLPQRPENEDENVFHLPTMSGNVTKHVRSVRDKAGITGKELTYHCSRHTAATLAISAGAELYSVSKILGHRSLVSTQVYAKVDLEKKMEAINLTKGVFD